MVESYDVKFEKQPFKVKYPVKVAEGVETGSKPENVYLSKVLETKRVTDEKHFQDTRLVRFEYSKGYKPGDVVNIHPVTGLFCTFLHCTFVHCTSIHCTFVYSTFVSFAFCTESDLN